MAEKGKFYKCRLSLTRSEICS